jgi:hypothetical protein
MTDECFASDYGSSLCMFASVLSSLRSSSHGGLLLFMYQISRRPVYHFKSD